MDCVWDKLGFMDGIKDDKCREMVKESFDKMRKYLSDKNENNIVYFVYFPFIRRSIELNEMNRVIEPEEIDKFFNNTKIDEMIEYCNENDEESQLKWIYKNIRESKLINDLSLYEFIMFTYNKKNNDVNLLLTLFCGFIDLPAYIFATSSEFFAYKNNLIK